MVQLASPTVTSADTPAAIDGSRLTAWLLGEGRFLEDNSMLSDQVCCRIVEAGVPLDRATLHLRALHPDYRGVSRICGAGRGSTYALWITASRRPRPIW